MGTKKHSASAHEIAATRPGEYEFLSAIVADLPDNAAKLVYADWLEEHGDRRATFVRQLVEATRSRKKNIQLPDAGAYPRAWTNMLGVLLLQGILAGDLVAVWDSVLRLARPILTLTTEPVAEKQLAVGQSKFGGHPDLPQTANWPTCEAGPLGFLGQINLDELAQTQVVRWLPRGGLLSFFAYQSYTSGHQPGAGPEVAGDTRVLYSPPSATLRRRPPPDDLGDDGNAPFHACRLGWCETWDLPDRQDVLPRQYSADRKKLDKGDRWEKVHEIRRQCHSFGHHLLGYSVHFRTMEDPSPGPDWSNLLCLNSDDHLDWSWCDGEHLAVFVHQDDLALGTIARVYGYAS
jgi:uncharacterized protein (TIGR02996 family)